MQEKTSFICINLAFSSLIRIFELCSKVGCISEIKEKTIFSLYFAHLFVPLQPK